MTSVTIVLQIEGDEENAAHVVDEVLDSGVLQDAINDWDGYVHVASAVVVYEP